MCVCVCVRPQSIKLVFIYFYWVDLRHNLMFVPDKVKMCSFRLTPGSVSLTLAGRSAAAPAAQ